MLGTALLGHASPISDESGWGGILHRESSMKLIASWHSSKPWHCSL